jgi:hypothetical protein
MTRMKDSPVGAMAMRQPIWRSLGVSIRAFLRQIRVPFAPCIELRELSEVVQPGS